MPWKCAECGAVEGEKIYQDTGEINADIVVVCHHCGKPLCQNHRYFIKDNAFAKTGNHDLQSVFHCRDCKQKHHPGVSSKGGVL